METLVTAEQSQVKEEEEKDREFKVMMDDADYMIYIHRETKFVFTNDGSLLFCLSFSS